MKVSIFLRSFSKDYDFLRYALRSIAKFASGFHSVVVCVPIGDPHPPIGTNELLVRVHNEGDGYMIQQADKMSADLHCPGAEAVLFLDSDCVFNQPVTPQSFMRNGKPLWLVTPWKDVAFDVKRAWFGCMAKAMMECPPYEFMRRHGIIIPSHILRSFRDFIQKTHEINHVQYTVNQTNRDFSEFNVAGFHAWLHHHDEISWHDTSELGVPPQLIDQAWSWGGLTPEIKQKLEAMLA